LACKGWGETKPVDSNTTLTGKANNRRVEFVKM
jgi:outer membrane protein OmpA-like peptidoglycan-associated protein